MVLNSTNSDAFCFEKSASTSKGNYVLMMETLRSLITNYNTKNWGISFRWFGHLLSMEHTPTRKRLVRSFQREDILLIWGKISFKNRKLFLNLFVWSMALYACEACTVSQREAFELWRFRRTLKIRWADRIRNEEVPVRIQRQRTPWKNAGKSRDTLTGHIAY